MIMVAWHFRGTEGKETNKNLFLFSTTPFSSYFSTHHTLPTIAKLFPFKTISASIQDQLRNPISEILERPICAVLLVPPTPNLFGFLTSFAVFVQPFFFFYFSFFFSPIITTGPYLEAQMLTAMCSRYSCSFFKGSGT